MSLRWAADHNSILDPSEGLATSSQQSAGGFDGDVGSGRAGGQQSIHVAEGNARADSDARGLSGQGEENSWEDGERDFPEAMPRARREDVEIQQARAAERVRAREERLAREREREEAVGERPGSTFDQTGCPEMNIRVQLVDIPEN